MHNRIRSSRFALDHITLVDATPVELAEIAFETGYTAINPFLHSMDVLPQMPNYDLIGDHGLREQFIDRMDQLNLGVDIAYPFTISKRTLVDELTPALDCASELKSRLVNVLLYDRNPISRQETFSRFCEHAHCRNLKVLVEFYPASQVVTIEDALVLVEHIGDAGVAGINVDLLHLFRSGGTLEQLAAIPPEYIAYAQLSDGPMICLPELQEYEASIERQLPGEGSLDTIGFLNTLPPDCPVSIEVPRGSSLDAKMTKSARARCAMIASQHILDKTDGSF